jgi:hypothetical protein
VCAYELHPDIIRANLEKARQVRDDAWLAYEEAEKQVTWWEEGARIFGVVSEAEVSADARLRELIPDTPDGTRLKPTLKQSMLLIMRANTRATWTVDQISQMLALNNWLPAADPSKRISDMASVMISENLLTRASRGEYLLTPDIAGALESRFPPVTDYTRMPAGWPVPDHPAGSEGLADD